MKGFSKNRVVITGAGSGLGRALTLEFASHGWNVCATDIDFKSAEETIQLTQLKGDSALAIKCDITNLSDLEIVAEKIKKEWGGVDLLINNAGIYVGATFRETPLSQWDRIINLNLKGVIFGCRAFIPLMIDQGFGYIVNTASAAGLFNLPRMSSYNTTKAAIIAFSETLRTELFPHHIAVSILAPSFFKSDLLKNGFYSSEAARVRGGKIQDRARMTAERVAKYTFRSLKKKRFYIIPNFYLRFLWRIKILFPGLYFRVLAHFYMRYFPTH